MSNLIKFKIFSKPVNDTNYHLATFTQRISKDLSIPKHHLDEVVRFYIAQYSFGINQSETDRQDIIKKQNELQNTNWTNRRLQALKFLFEENRQDDKVPAKFYGF